CRCAHRWVPDECHRCARRERVQPLQYPGRYRWRRRVVIHRRNDAAGITAQKMTIDIDEAKVERNELGLWLGWTLATAGGMLLGFLPTILLVNVLNLGLAQIAVPVLAGTVI